MNLFGDAGRALGGLFGPVFGGPADPRLSEEQNRQAQRFAMMQSGLATLASGSPNGLQAVAQGAMQGQQAGAGMRGQMYAQNQQQAASAAQQEFAKMVQSGDMTPDKLKQIYAHAVASGDSALANSVVGYMKQNENAPPKRRTQMLPDGSGLMDLDTGVVIPVQGHTPAPKAPVRGTPEWFAMRKQELEQERELRPKLATFDQGAFARENSIGDDFRGNQTVKAATDLAQTYATAQSAKSLDSAIGDQTLIIALNKMLDPSSIVKEGEFDRVAKASGFKGQAQAYANKMLKAGRLPSDIRGQIIRQIDDLAATHQKNFGATLNMYKKRAGKAKVDADAILYDPFELVGLKPGGRFGDL